MRRFLTHIVEAKLNNRAGELKEQSLATDVFGKEVGFDTRLNPIVRVEARRLRNRLLEYYNQAGKEDPILIELPRGGYAPKFSFRTVPDEPGETTAAAAENSSPAPLEQAVAVLPFVDMSPGLDNRHFCDGLTEEVINALTRVKGLNVVARSSAFQFQGAAQDVREVGAKLGVGFVMEGSVRQSGERVRVTVQLNYAHSGFHRWAETFDIAMGEHFATQEEIATNVVAKLRAQRSKSIVGELTKRRTTNTKADQHYIQGVYSLRQIRDSHIGAALRHFEKAIELDPDYAQAYAGLADCYCNSAWVGLEASGAAMAEAKTAAAKALELDSSGAAGAAARAALGCAYCIGDWNYRAGHIELAQALEEDPGEYLAAQWLALAHMAPLGRIEDALSILLAGSERAGNSLLAQNHVGLVHFYSGDYEEARRWQESILRESPEFAQAQWDLGRVHLAREQFEEAHAAISRAVEISGSKSLFLGTLGFCEAAMGNTASAKKLANNLVKGSETNYVSSLAIAHIHLGLENKDEAFRWLQLALEERACRLVEFDNDPIYDGIRDDDRSTKLREALCLTLPSEPE